MLGDFFKLNINSMYNREYYMIEVDRGVYVRNFNLCFDSYMSYIRNDNYFFYNNLYLFVVDIYFEGSLKLYRLVFQNRFQFFFYGYYEVLIRVQSYGLEDFK